MRFEEAPDIKEMAVPIAEALFENVDMGRMYFIRSRNTKTRAIARIWSLPKVWRKFFKVKAHYAVEVISEKFDELSFEEKEKVIIHELMHVPKGFSGGLVPHNCFGKKIGMKEVNAFHKEYKSKS